MRQISKSTSTFPLMLYFSKARPMEIINAEDIEMVYDSDSQITLFMGGGGSKSASRSQTSTKRTRTGTDARTNRDKYIDDHEFGSDD